jgi:hypothetical protein
MSNIISARLTLDFDPKALGLPVGSLLIFTSYDEIFVRVPNPNDGTKPKATFKIDSMDENILYEARDKKRLEELVEIGCFSYTEISCKPAMLLVWISALTNKKFKRVDDPDSSKEVWEVIE